jgi:hypothetical protein
LPWAGRHVGSDGVKRFFHLLAESMTYEGFDMQHVVADASTVVAIIEAWGFAKATGRTFRGTIVRIYVFRDGKIAKVQNIFDTAAYAAALIRGRPRGAVRPERAEALVRNQHPGRRAGRIHAVARPGKISRIGDHAHPHGRNQTWVGFPG